MTLTVMFKAPWQWKPFLTYCWEESVKCLAMGWGPLQIYLTNFSPISVNNTWQETIYYLLDKDDEKMSQIFNIVTDEENLSSEKLEQRIAELKKIN